MLKIYTQHYREGGQQSTSSEGKKGQERTPEVSSYEELQEDF